MPPETPLYTEFPVKFLTDLTTQLPFTSYFDIACGTGGFSIALGLQGHKVLGADYNNVAIEIAKAKLASLGLPEDQFVRTIDNLAGRIDPNNEGLLGLRFGKNLSELLKEFSTLEAIEECGPKFMGDFPELETCICGIDEDPDVTFEVNNVLSDLGQKAEPYQCMTNFMLLHMLNPDVGYQALKNIVDLTTEGKGLIMSVGTNNRSLQKDFWDFLEDLGFEKNPLSEEFEDRLNRFAMVMQRAGFLPEDMEDFEFSENDLRRIDFRNMMNGGGYMLPPDAIQSYVGVRKHVSSNVPEEKMRDFCKQLSH